MQFSCQFSLFVPRIYIVKVICCASIVACISPSAAPVVLSRPIAVTLVTVALVRIHSDAPRS